MIDDIQLIENLGLDKLSDNFGSQSICPLLSVFIFLTVEFSHRNTFRIEDLNLYLIEVGYVLSFK